jgi:hypothetical protein
VNAETIRELLRRQPFEPFEIRMTIGDVRLIRHPELAMLVGGRLVIGYPENERIAIVSLLHIAGVELRQAV